MKRKLILIFLLLASLGTATAQKNKKDRGNRQIPPVIFSDPTQVYRDQFDSIVQSLDSVNEVIDRRNESIVNQYNQWYSTTKGNGVNTPDSNSFLRGAEYAAIQTHKLADFITTLIRTMTWNDPPSAPEKGYTSDIEKLFSKKQVRKLNKLIKKFEKKTTMEIGIITLDTSYVSRERFDSLSTRIANKWGVGKAGLDNGVLISISKGYRTMRISNGYGIEKIMTDEETKKIIDEEFTPYFKKGEYYEGTLNGLKKLMEVLRGKKKK
jgi:uncharacterized protein